MVRLWLLVLLVSGACGGGTRTQGGGGAGGASAGGAGGSGGGGAATPVKRTPKPITFAACTAPPCMLHEGRGRYHQCLNLGGGHCFQYGPPCAPADRCMRDPRDGAHRTCDQVVAGECVKFSDATCSPR